MGEDKNLGKDPRNATLSDKVEDADDKAGGFPNENIPRHIYSRGKRFRGRRSRSRRRREGPGTIDEEDNQGKYATDLERRLIILS